MMTKMITESKKKCLQKKEEEKKKKINHQFNSVKLHNKHYIITHNKLTTVVLIIFIY